MSRIFFEISINYTYKFNQQFKISMGAAISAEKTTHNKTNIEYIKIPSFSRINIQARK